MTTNLADRVEGLDGPCRETDALIAVALGHEAMNELFYRGDWSDRVSDEGAYEKLPRYTASLDAVVALIEKELPGWRWGVHWLLGAPYRGYVSERGPFRPMPVTVDAETPALALLAALLRAKEADHG